MPGFSLRRLSRRLSASLTFLFLFAIAGALVAEFFIELGKEQGWYQQPAQRVEAAMTAFSVFVTQTWFLVLAAALTGLTAGLWSDVALRKREAIWALSNIAPNELLLKAAPGQLDYIVEGLEGINDITKIFTALAKHTEQIATTMEKYNRRFSRVTDPHKRRKLAAALSLKLNAFAEKIGGYAPQISDATKRTQVNCHAVIEGTPILNLGTLNSLLDFGKTLQVNITSAERSALVMGESLVAVQSIVGISRDLNFSSQLISDKTEALRIEIKTYAAVCEGLLSAANTRAEVALKALTNPPETPLSPQQSDTAEKTPP
jgi:hypothetical protein